MANLDSRETAPSLLVRLRDNQDDAAWQTFVGVYAPLIYRYCRRHRLQDADATDVSQEVLAQVARSIRTFEYQPERGRFRDWLGTVTRNKLLRFLEKEGRTVCGQGGDFSDAVLNESAAPEADSEWTAQFNAHLLQVALERIRSQFEQTTWTAFEQVWLENRPAAAVSQEVGLSLTSVYVAKSRVLKRLREEVLLLAEDVPTVYLHEGTDATSLPEPPG
jgi:RNA polymerase sigma-70 factor (ECF subfamily)